MADSLTTDLEGRLTSALAAIDMDAVFAYLEFTIRERTLAGEFLEGSTPGASRYHDRAHIRRREKVGRQVAHVDLYFGYDEDDDPKPHMLDGMKGRSDTFADEIRAEFGYIEGLSDAESIRLATYHHEGGSAGDIRRFVGLTPQEEQRLVQLIQDDFLARF